MTENADRNKSYLISNEEDTIEKLKLILHQDIPLLGDIHSTETGIYCKDGHVIKIILNNDSITAIPKEIADLQYLETLVLFSNSIQEFPRSFSLLKSLKILELYLPKLDSLPESMYDFKKLQKLVLSGSTIPRISHKVDRLQSLEEIFIDKNDDDGNCVENQAHMQYFALPCEIGTLPSLKKIVLKNFPKILVPESIFNISKLSHFEIHNSIVVFHKINSMQLNNQFFDYEDDELDSFIIPEDIGHWINLEVFIACAINLKELPASFCELKNLSRLELQHNLLKQLPRNFRNLQKLSYLDLSDNQINAIPPNFSDLLNLRELNLSKNKLDQSTIDSNLPLKLSKLNLNFNFISKIPPSIFMLTELSLLKLYGNPIEILPLQILRLENVKKIAISPLILKNTDIETQRAIALLKKRQCIIEITTRIGL